MTARPRQVYCPRHPAGDATCIMQDAAVRQAVYHEPPQPPSRLMGLLVGIAYIIAALFTCIVLWLAIVGLLSLQAPA